MKGIRYIFLTILMGCIPQSIQECRYEASVLIHQIVSDLNAIETRDELMAKEPLLKKKMERLVGLMIKIQEIQKKERGIKEKHLETNPLLIREFKRIYAIPGCGEVMERIQHAALNRLDAYDQTQKGRGA